MSIDIPDDIDAKIRELVIKMLGAKFTVKPISEKERFKLNMARKNAKEPGEVIEVKPGVTKDGDMVFSYINDRWRNASYEKMSDEQKIKRAEEDKKRLEMKQRNKETL